MHRFFVASSLIRLGAMALLVAAPCAYASDDSPVEDNSAPNPLAVSLRAEEGEPRLFNAFDDDVFGYFNLEERQGENEAVYDTPLKKKMFKKTPEYAGKLAEMRKFRKSAEKSTFFFEVSSEIGEFEIVHGWFEVQVGGNIEAGCSGRPPKAVGDFYLDNLPTVKVPGLLPGQQTEVLRIRMPEAAALKIEQNTDRLKVYVVFTPQRITAVPFRVYALNFRRWCNVSAKLLSGRALRIVVADPDTGEVFFEVKVK